ncbi:MAG: GIY-YIG nuclease family protein [Gloeomargaritaceae cyanobacterium C42_A2020_066]|nr:GIY-YIG nuclease family protein [Gloeomargaritaceae cyanobacterium C42_A2020_066]
MSESNALAGRPFLPFVDAQGYLPAELQGRVGVYAIYDQAQVLQYIGYSRDIHLSLKNHLVRQPHQCYWLKVETVDRPSRTLLESLRQAWLAEQPTLPPGNGPEQARWEAPIQVQDLWTPQETAVQPWADPNLDDVGRERLLKQAARQLEEQILARLAERGVQEPIRFNPKLKAAGRLDLT